MTSPAEHAATVRALAQELHEALDDPKRYEWGEGPWEHLGDAERDVRLLIEGVFILAARADELERERDEQATLAKARKVSRRMYRERAERLEAALREIMDVRWTQHDGADRYTPTVRNEIRATARAALGEQPQ